MAQSAISHRNINNINNNNNANILPSWSSSCLQKARCLSLTQMSPAPSVDSPQSISEVVPALNMPAPSPAVRQRVCRPSPSLRPLQQQDWYHGTVTRRRAEQALLADGYFLVRDSISQSNEYVLTAMHNKKCWHFQINRSIGPVTKTDLFHFEEEKFDNVVDLIDFYRVHRKPITESSQCLISHSALLGSGRSQTEFELEASYATVLNGHDSPLKASGSKPSAPIRPLPKVPVIPNNMSPLERRVLMTEANKRLDRKYGSESHLTQQALTVQRKQSCHETAVDTYTTLGGRSSCARSSAQLHKLSLGANTNCVLSDLVVRDTVRPRRPLSSDSGHDEEEQHDYSMIDYEDMDKVTDAKVSSQREQTSPTLPDRPTGDTNVLDRDSGCVSDQESPLYDTLSRQNLYSTFNGESQSMEIRRVLDRLLFESPEQLAAAMTQQDCVLMKCCPQKTQFTALLQLEGQQTRLNIIRRSEHIVSLVLECIRAGRDKALGQWVFIADCLAESGNHYGLSNVMQALAQPLAIQTIALANPSIRRRYNGLLIAQSRNMEKSEDCTIPNMTPVCQLLQTPNALSQAFSDPLNVQNVIDTLHRAKQLMANPPPGCGKCHSAPSNDRPRCVSLLYTDKQKLKTTTISSAL